jgi:type II secretory pathway pseudopilin PulG
MNPNKSDKGKFKGESAITLIALIVMVVIIVILSAVTIRGLVR